MLRFLQLKWQEKTNFICLSLVLIILGLSASVEDEIEQLNVKLAVILASYGWDLEQVRKSNCSRLFHIYPT